MKTIRKSQYSSEYSYKAIGFILLTRTPSNFYEDRQQYNITTILSSGSGGSLVAVFADCTTAHIDELRFVR